MQILDYYIIPNDRFQFVEWDEFLDIYSLIYYIFHLQL